MAIQSEIYLAKNIKLDRDKIVTNMVDMIRCKTVSYRDESLVDRKEFEKFESLLKARYPLIHSTCNLQKIGKTESDFSQFSFYFFTITYILLTTKRLKINQRLFTVYQCVIFIMLQQLILCILVMIFHIKTPKNKIIYTYLIIYLFRIFVNAENVCRFI